jgi:glycosyltransferase involved in cell wall biosynthesis
MIYFNLKKIIIVGSFKKTNNVSYGGIYYASTSLRDKFIEEGFTITELDTTIKDISDTRIKKRIFSLFLRNIYFVSSILLNPRSKNILIFISSGTSYIDKLLPIIIAKVMFKKIIIFPCSGHIISDYKNSFYKIFINFVFYFSSKVICQSSFWESFFKDHGVSNKKLFVLENWVPNSVISRTLNFKKKFLHDNTFKIISVSRIEKDKGIDSIINLAVKLNGKLNFIIDIYGTGSYEQELIQLIKLNNLQNIVNFKGWLSNDKMYTTIYQYDVAILFSNIEGYPNVILDYIFSKIPIIASDNLILRSIGKKYISYTDTNNLDSMLEDVLNCKLHYNKISDNAIKIYNLKLEKNNINFVFNKIKSIL